MRIIASLCAASLLAGCGGGAELDSQSKSELSHHGISIAVPSGWSGRVVFTDPAGEGAVMFQLANFALSPNEGFAAAPELPPGEEDPIKAMAGDDILLMISTDQATALDRTLPVRITKASFLPRGSPVIPRGHATAEEAGCFEGRCLRVTVDFASEPSPKQLMLANDALGSLAIRGRQ